MRTGSPHGGTRQSSEIRPGRYFGSSYVEPFSDGLLGHPLVEPGMCYDGCAAMVLAHRRRGC